MAITINGSGTVTGLAVGGLPDGTVDAGTLATDSVTAVKIPDTVEAYLKSGRKNLIINGAMQVTQRGTSTTSANSAGYFEGADRMRRSENNLGSATFTREQSTDAPEGFSYSLKETTTTVSDGTTDRAYRPLNIRIEGQNLQHLAWGTSAAKSITFSFWVKSSVTGTYSIAVLSYDSSNYISITTTYTISSANTWEYKTVTIPGNTNANIRNTNEKGLDIMWCAGTGSNFTSTDSTSWGDYGSGGWHYGQTADVCGTLNATWQVTGVQLEVGSQATDFEHRSYGEELALCQRYFQRWGTLDAAVLGLAGQCVSSSTAYFAGQTIIPMRTIPTGSVINVTNFRVRNATSSGVPSITGLTVSTYSETEYMLYASGASGLAAGDASHLLNYNGTNRGYIDFNAEL